MPTLNWIGKEAVVEHHRHVPTRLLECDRELSVGDPEAENLLVEGDNLEALKALLPRYRGQVKCIYIDPPYNTGNEGWIYNDNVNDPRIRKWLGDVVGKEAEDLCRHDKWLCMMYPRLALLREFLRDDGVIFISIDDNEVATLRLVLDEIFGVNRFIGCFIWKSRQQRDNRNTTGVSIDHEYIYCYGRRLRGATRDRGMYSNPDHDPRGDWSSSNMVGLATKEARPNLHYDLVNPETGIKYRCPPKGWRYEQETMTRLASEGKILWPKTPSGRPRRKFFYSELVEEFTGFPLIVGDGIFTRHGTKDLLDTTNSLDFAFPKPTALICQLIAQATDGDSIVLDSFAGSGTTAHAVLSQNQADGGKRRFLLVEVDSAISRNVTARRLRRVCEGDGEALGSGFRYCRLGRTLLDADGNINGDVPFADLARYVYLLAAGVPVPKQPRRDCPLLGMHHGQAIYLLYNGVLGDRRPAGGNVLTGAVLAALPPHPAGRGPRVVYGEACRLGEATLRREDVTFRQVPYSLRD